ncbi:778_t:CDS:2, partial [Diversispora eburnea]
TCEIKISEYYYSQLCMKIESYGHNIIELKEELERAANNGHFLCEYDNGLIIFKPISRWKMVRNRVTGYRYSRASGAGLQCFDKRVQSERQTYSDLLRREAKGITDLLSVLATNMVDHWTIRLMNFNSIRDFDQYISSDS